LLQVTKEAMSKLIKTHRAFGITMRSALLKELDEQRGMVPRSPYIEHIVEQYMSLTEKKLMGPKFPDQGTQAATAVDSTPVGYDIEPNK
jgi:hypothetical protein